MTDDQKNNPQPEGQPVPVEESPDVYKRQVYHYSYREQWQPKDISVVFRMYQLNLDGDNNRVYRAYWDKFPEHFVETEL